MAAKSKTTKSAASKTTKAKKPTKRQPAKPKTPKPITELHMPYVCPKCKSAEVHNSPAFGVLKSQPLRMTIIDGDLVFESDTITWTRKRCPCGQVVGVRIFTQDQS